MTTTRRPGRARLASAHVAVALAPSSRLARVVVVDRRRLAVAHRRRRRTARVVGSRRAPTPRGRTSQKARGDETAKQAEITNLEGILAQLQSDLDAKNAEAEQRGDELQKAQSAYDDAAVQDRRSCSRRPTPPTRWPQPAKSARVSWPPSSVAPGSNDITAT